MYHCLDATQPEKSPLNDESSKVESDNEKIICCANCGAYITRSDFAIEINGLHQHTRENPHHHVFTFRCFSEVDNIFRTGDATDEHSWFTSLKWQICFCQCDIHIGWYFSGAENFFALLTNRIIENNRQ